MGTHPGEYTLGVTSMENACGSHLTDLHAIMWLTLPSGWQDLHVLAFFLHLGNPYTFLKASQRPSLGGALPSSVSLTPSPFVLPIFLYVAVGVVAMALCNL